MGLIKPQNLQRIKILRELAVDRSLQVSKQLFPIWFHSRYKLGLIGGRVIEAIGAILSRNRGQTKEERGKQGRCRTGKDVVKVLENGSSVAVHAESHVAWILLS